MRGAYEGLMKAQPNMMQGPAESMGGKAQPAGWKDVTPVAEGQIDQILSEMDALRAKYSDPGMDILPEDAAHMSHLRQMLHRSHEWQQHSLEKAKEQTMFSDELNMVGQETELQRALKSAGAGKIPPPAGVAPPRKLGGR